LKTALELVHQIGVVAPPLSSADSNAGSDNMNRGSGWFSAQAISPAEMAICSLIAEIPNIRKKLRGGDSTLHSDGDEWCPSTAAQAKVLEYSSNESSFHTRDL